MFSWFINNLIHDQQPRPPFCILQARQRVGSLVVGWLGLGWLNVDRASGCDVHNFIERLSALGRDRLEFQLHLVVNERLQVNFTDVLHLGCKVASAPGFHCNTQRTLVVEIFIEGANEATLPAEVVRHIRFKRDFDLRLFSEWRFDRADVFDGNDDGIDCG